MTVFLQDGVEAFSGGNGADLDVAVFFEGIEGAVDGGESHAAIVVPQFDVEVLGGDGAIECGEEVEDLGLAAGAAGFHGGIVGTEAKGIF